MSYISCRYEDIKRRQDNVNEIIMIISNMKSSVAINKEGKTEDEIFRARIDLKEAIDILNETITRLESYAKEKSEKLDPKGAMINVIQELNNTPFPIKKRIN